MYKRQPTGNISVEATSVNVLLLCIRSCNLEVGYRESGLGVEMGLELLLLLLFLSFLSRSVHHISIGCSISLLLASARSNA